jgi:hypothetical protein
MQVLRDSRVHLLHRQWGTMWRLQQSTNAPSIGLNPPSRDGVVFEDSKVEDSSGIETQPIPNFLGQRDLSLTGECGEHL